MMNIQIVTVGKLKEKYIKEAVGEYSKRLSKYCKLEMVEVPDEKAPENLSNAEAELIKNKEGQGILKHIRDDAYVISLEIMGRMLSSEGLADHMNSLALKGKSNITFVIGGSLGLSEQVSKRADFHLSFSLMTFPHQLMKVILLEQIYRGFRILGGGPYHK